MGPYTAAAVASISFGDAAAAVDGNVIRVVSRLRALDGDPTKLSNVSRHPLSMTEGPHFPYFAPYMPSPARSHQAQLLCGLLLALGLEANQHPSYL